MLTLMRTLMVLSFVFTVAIYSSSTANAQSATAYVNIGGDGSPPAAGVAKGNGGWTNCNGITTYKIKCYKVVIKNGKRVVTDTNAITQGSVDNPNDVVGNFYFTAGQNNAMFATGDTVFFTIQTFNNAGAVLSTADSIDFKVP